MNADLFAPAPVATDTQAELGQYMTPAWLAEAIVERYCPELAPGARVVDPTCGDGAFLAALPDHVERIGIEIDPNLAARARRIPGTTIYNESLESTRFRGPVDCILGNPPFFSSMLEVVLGCAAAWLPRGAMAGLILPAYLLQTANRVSRYNQTWGLSVEMIPRNVFPNLEKPLVFARFLKDQKQICVGLAFYDLTSEVNSLDERYRETLTRGRGSVWLRTVADAIKRLGGRATLPAIYHEIQGRRPTPNAHWQAKVRQVLQQHFHRFQHAEYGFAEAQAA